MKVIPLLLAFGWVICIEAAAAKLPGARAVTDAADYPSLQAAIDAVPVTGGMLRLPPGEFIITEPLRIRHRDLRIEGAGTATWIRNENTAGKPALIVSADPAAPDALERGRLWRIMLSNFRLTGNDRSGHGVVADRVNELFVQGVTISQHGGDGIHCTQCYEDMRLNDCLITYNKGAGFFARGNHDTIVSACQFEENRDGIVFVDGFNLTLTGNNIDDHLQHGVVVELSSASVLSANMIENSSGCAIVIDRDAYGITVSGNVFAQNLGGGLDLRDGHGIVVSGNSIMRVKQFGVRVSTESGRIAITGNAFSDSFAGRGLIRAKGNRIPGSDLNDAAGIRLESARDVAIAGNTFTGLITPPLVKAGDCAGIVFENNVIVDSPRAAQPRR